MPLGDFEREVLRLLAANRHPDSFVGGGTVLHQSPDSLRSSKDVDYFHDTIESLAASVQRDASTLRESGYEVELGHPRTLSSAPCRTADKSGMGLRQCLRFFPVERDLELGWRLNFWDAATNKVLAFAGRSKVRDLLDVVYLHQRHFSLGALAWPPPARTPA